MHAQEAIRLIRRQADRLRTLDAFDSRQPVFRRWFRETKAALDAIFGAATGPNREFQEIIFQPLTTSKADPDSDWLRAYEKGLPVALAFFDSVVEDLTAHPDHAGAKPAAAAAEPRRREKSAPEAAPARAEAAHGGCLILGDENGARDEVARLLDQIGIRAVSIGGPSDLGVSILDRLDEHAPIAFAVVLTAGDKPEEGARKRTAASPAPPARSGRNAALEMGILLGRLGRDHVCVLTREGGETPDEEKIIHFEIDARGAWKLDLARTMKTAGLPVEFNNAIL